MTRPGDRLRTLAARVFDAETMERLIDPVIADLQMEYAEASRAGLIWRRRWVRAVGYAAFAAVATRTLRVFLVSTLAFTLLLELPYLSTIRISGARALYLVPQALVLAVPMALTLAIAWPRRTGHWSRKSSAGTIASGAVCSIVVFVMLAWWVPSANQAFRVSMAQELGRSARPLPGLPEMTIGQLREQMKWARTVDAEWRALEFNYHLRWAFSCASLMLTFLMVALRQRGITRRFMVLVVPILFGYYALMFVSREYTMARYVLTPAAGAWMPNAIVMLTAVVISTVGTRRQVVA